jgi:SAM-dependent methyltransferase
MTAHHSSRPSRSDQSRRINFDTWKDSYREEVDKVVAFSGQDADYFTELKARSLIDLARRRVGDPAGLTALDVGCGVGVTDRYLVESFAEVIGVDIFEGVLERAAATNPQARYMLYDGRDLPLGDGSVDVAFAICVVHHVPPPQWPAFAAEMARVLRPGGIAAMFEHNPLNPLTRRVVSNCVFDENAVLLRRRTAACLLREAGLIPCEDRYIALLPSDNRVVAAIEAALRGVPLGAQYYVSAIKGKGATGACHGPSSTPFWE